MKSNILAPAILIFLLLPLHCVNVEEREPPETASDVLNSFVRSATFQYIDLDEPELLEIVLTDDDFIFSIYTETDAEPPLLGNIERPFTRAGRGHGVKSTPIFHQYLL